MTQSREDSVYLAKLAEQAERYEGLLLSFFALAALAHPSVQRWSRT